MQNFNQNIEYLPDTNYSTNFHNIKITEKFVLVFFILIIIILLLLCYFINGLTNEINALTKEIQHYNYHYYGCCSQFYN